MALGRLSAEPYQVAIRVEDRSGVGEARRQAAALAKHVQLDVSAAGNLGLAVTEAATNIVKHAGHGEIVLRELKSASTQGIELLALDKGPGIANVAESMRDGHSTAGSPGTGLGALLRMTREFELYTQPGAGTVMRCEVWPANTPARTAEAELVGAISTPMQGERVCGDDWVVASDRGRGVALVVDGLGHGVDAADAARAAVDVVRRNARLGAGELMEHVHAALRPTRGAAAAIAVLDRAAGVCSFCGVGNISASLYASGKPRSLISQNGTLGHQVRKISEFSYPLEDDALCILHSDGLSARWSLDAYPGLAARHPALVAAVLYRDFRRPRDDATVLCLRNTGPTP